VGWLFRARRDRDHLAEFEDHLRSLTDLYISEGVSPSEAARRARVRFGNPAAKRQEIRDVDRWHGVRVVSADLRYAIRGLRRSPAFTLAAAATLALGIGANTAVFSVVQAVLLRPLPYVHPEQLVGISFRAPDPKRFMQTVPSPVLLAWREQSGAFDSFGAYGVGQATFVTANGEPVSLMAAGISSNVFALLDPQAIERGRAFGPSDETTHADPVVILSHRFSSQRLGPDSSTVGSTIRLSGSAYSIVGITSDAFRFPDYGTPDVYFPLDLRVGSPVVVSVSVIGRLRPALSIKAAADDLARVSQRASPTYPSAMSPILAAGPTPQVVPLQRRIAGDLSGILWIALGAVGCILLIACANVTGLMVARMTGREREMAMRTALGATPRRLGQWLLAESLVLTTLGTALGLLCLFGTMTEIRALLAGAVPHAESIGIDRSVLACSAMSLVLTAVLCAAIPVWRMRRQYRVVSLKLSSSGPIRATAPDAIRRALVSGQVAVALMLLVGALLLSGTLSRLAGVGLGFDASHLLTLRISATGFGNSQSRAIQVQDLLDRVGRLPGASAVGASDVLPLGGHSFRFMIPVEGEPPPTPLAQDDTGVDVISPGYFKTLRVHIVEGREFDDRDSTTAPPVAIVNRTFARLNISGRDPIGRHLSLGGTPADANIAIVGVVDDFKDGNPGDAPEPAVYRPLSQAAPQIGWGVLALAVRTASDPHSFFQAARRAINEVVPDSAVYDAATMDDRLAATVAPQRLRAVVFSLFAGTAILLAVVGLYGLLASAVAQNMHELGVRMALGAARRELISFVAWRALTPTGVGIVLGFAGALAFARLLSDRLYGVTSLDPVTYAEAALVMMAASIAASCLPAYRASMVDPIRVLRTD
jgi:predicted permease